MVGLRGGGKKKPLRGAVGTIKVRRGFCWRARQRVREVRCLSSQLIISVRLLVYKRKEVGGRRLPKLGEIVPT